MAESRTSWGLIGLGIALALGLIISATVVARTLLDIKSENRALVVKGYAERPIHSDYAEWEGQFTTRARSLETASAELARHGALVKRFLGTKGIAEDDCEMLPVQTRTLFARNEKGHTTNEVEGYALSRKFRIGSSDIELVSEIAMESADLVRQGIELSSSRPQFFCTKLTDLKISMLGEATEDARRRAEALAEHGGGSVGALLSARQGVFQITPVHSTEISDYGRNDTSSREKMIKAVVTLRYAVRR
jgi:hypothetical protein